MSGSEPGDPPQQPGPSFTAPGDDWTPSKYRSAAAGPEARTEPRPSPPPDLAPPRRRLPALLTVLAVLVVGGVVLAASLRSTIEPTTVQPVAPVRLSAPRAVATSSGNQAPFRTTSGQGVLTLVDHTLSDAGTRLSVTVTVTAIEGEVEVDPSLFSILDVDGGTHEPLYSVSAGDELQFTTLSAGQSSTGRLTFSVPRGELAVLMGDSVQGITAIKIPR